MTDTALPAVLAWDAARHGSLDHVAEELIWGHRFYNDQTTWLLVLEFLNVADACSRSRSPGESPLERDADGHEPLCYALRQLALPRYLIFNNPYMAEVRESSDTNARKWQVWLEKINDNRQGLTFDYLQRRFDSHNGFEELCQVVAFFQSTAIEGQSNKRWTSRFLYPYGADCLYADIKPKVTVEMGVAGPDGQSRTRVSLGSMDRRFFGRGGELMYLMFLRSPKGLEALARIEDKLLRPTHRWNRLVRALEDPNVQVSASVSVPQGGFLPCPTHRIYTQLAQDWLHILGLQLGGEASMDALVRITSLNLLLYLYERGLEVAGDTARPLLVLEVAATRRKALFERARQCYRANQEILARALDAFIAQSKRQWEESVGANAQDGAQAMAFLRQHFHWNAKKSGSAASVDEAFEKFREAVFKRHNQHFAKVPGVWARGMGLARSQQGVGTWYAPEDAFLRALVLANVGEREELRLFLARLYTRYHIVIGPMEAEQAFGGQLPLDSQEFAENMSRFEERLRTLGLLDRLSDDCAFVKNPFASGGSHAPQ